MKNYIKIMKIYNDKKMNIPDHIIVKKTILNII